MIVIVLAVELVLMILLHAPGGVEVTVLPNQITSLRDPPKGERGIHFPPEANCLLGLTDGKQLPVVETCAKVRSLVAKEEEE